MTDPGVQKLIDMVRDTEAESLRIDAERYRWVRSQVPDPERLDLVVDAARGAPRVGE